MDRTNSEHADEEDLTALESAASSPDPTQFHTLTAAAAKSGNIPLLRRALALGASPSEHSLVIKTLSNGSPQLLACLLDAGLDVNHHIAGYNGTPLCAAAAFAKIALIEFLLSRGADPNINDTGWGQYQLRPLAAAAEGWSIRHKDAARAMEVLLEGGARWEGSGALQIAAVRGRVECVRVLVRAGVDVDEVVGRIEEVKGRRAVELAGEKGFEEVVGVLREGEPGSKG